MKKKKLTLKDKILLSVSATILVALIAFLIAFWDTAYYLLEQMISGVEFVQEYILSFGITGIIAMMLIIIICFFFPFISSMPIQIACGITYGLFAGSAIVLVAMFISTQLLYLFRQNLRIFSSPIQVERRLALEKMIKESDRNIYFALIIAYLLPGIPFIVISNLAASGLKYARYTLVTVLGMIPDILVTIFLGEKLLSSSPVASMITLLAIVVIIILSVVFNGKLVQLIFAPKKKKNDSENKASEK